MGIGSQNKIMRQNDDLKMMECVPNPKLPNRQNLFNE